MLTRPLLKIKLNNDNFVWISYHIKFSMNWIIKIQRLKSLFYNVSQVDLNWIEINPDHKKEEKIIKESNQKKRIFKVIAQMIVGLASKVRASTTRKPNKNLRRCARFGWESINRVNVQHRLEDFNIDWKSNCSQKFH